MVFDCGIRIKSLPMAVIGLTIRVGFAQYSRPNESSSFSLSFSVRANCKHLDEIINLSNRLYFEYPMKIKSSIIDSFVLARKSTKLTNLTFSNSIKTNNET